ncbi:hypothetical protein RMATCC62417_13626 [Rhizopus microsporus]|nr:hypothetical protein RMATCC62417_13626 [Rhizopus microsporus]
MGDWPRGGCVELHDEKDIQERQRCPSWRGMAMELERFKVTLKDDFDPCDPKVLRDPKYADLSPEERANFALMHHSDRMARAPNCIRAPVKYSVARFFCSKG